MSEARSEEALCPLCPKLGRKSTLIEQDLCPNCGSLEGLIPSIDVPSPSGLVGHDWMSGSVAPWRTRDGKTSYATPALNARAALAEAGLTPTIFSNEIGGLLRSVVIDLGCGDGQILREAASQFGAHGIGLDIDVDALAEARSKIAEDGVDSLVSLKIINFMTVDLTALVLEAGDPHTTTVIITAFLLPAALELLRPKLEEVVASLGCTVITFQWNFGEKWRGPVPGESDPNHRFTVYRSKARRFANAS